MKSKILNIICSFKGFFSSCIYYLHFKRIFQVCFVDRIDRLERIYETLSLNEITFQFCLAWSLLITVILVLAQNLNYLACNSNYYDNKINAKKFLIYDKKVL